MLGAFAGELAIWEALVRLRGGSGGGVSCELGVAVSNHVDEGLKEGWL